MEARGSQMQNANENTKIWLEPKMGDGKGRIMEDERDEGI
jgi:hypothetical protein